MHACELISSFHALAPAGSGEKAFPSLRRARSWSLVLPGAIAKSGENPINTPFIVTTDVCRCGCQSLTALLLIGRLSAGCDRFTAGGLDHNNVILEIVSIKNFLLDNTRGRCDNTSGFVFLARRWGN